MRGWRRLACCGLAGLALAGPAAAAGDIEYAVKAAYLTKFVPFIDWPDTAFASPASPVTLCVLGKGPFAGRLEADAAAAEGGRALAVRHVDGPDPACQILFLDGKSGDAENVLAALKDAPVVTVTDSGMAASGIISFVIEGNHVRFDIDAAAADVRGIRISAKLLGLARKVIVGESAP